jgi:hypothetical protein
MDPPCSKLDSVVSAALEANISSYFEAKGFFSSQFRMITQIWSEARLASKFHGHPIGYYKLYDPSY